MLKSIKCPIKRLSPWLIAMLLINLFQSLLVMPAPALAQEPETHAISISVFSFGAGSEGQLGHGNTDNQHAPKKIEGLSDIQAIAGGRVHSLALTKSGDVYSFGSGYFGQLGHGDRDEQVAPKKIEGLSDIQAIAAGAQHSLALTKSGDVYSFGSGENGQLGHGDRDEQVAPKKIEGLSDIQAIAAGTHHSLALTKSGDVYSFGYGYFGQLGHGDPDDQVAPKKIEGLSDIHAIAAGGHHSLALTKSGDVYSFGSGGNGQLGHEDTVDQLSPKKIEGLSDIQAIAGGGAHSLALTKSGDVFSFGYGWNGQLGHGDPDDQAAPKKIEGLSDIQAIAAGALHSLALKESGDVYSFGSGENGQLGHGDPADQYAPKKIEGLSNVKTIAAGYSHSLVLIAEAKQDSTIHPDKASFDKNILKQQDIAVTMELNGNTLTGKTNGATLLTAAKDYTIDNNMVTITKSYLSTLPIGITTLQFTFSAGAGQSLIIEIIETGDDHHSSVFSFGAGSNGQLGHGGTANQLTPKEIEGLSDIQAIAGGGVHSLALTESGDVYSFGYGWNGELGHGGLTLSQPSPKKIEGLSDIQAIAGGGAHSLALTKSGDVYSFGLGGSGQLGHGNTANQFAPKKIEGLSDIQAIAAAGGGVHSLALTKSGDVYSFGYGNSGQLGHGDTDDQRAPKKIEGLSDIQAIAAGGAHSLALTESGDVYSFGLGGNGQLGHGDTANQFAPKKIEGLSDIQAIAAVGTHSLALTKSGDVYSFGLGGNGQLGHGNAIDQRAPKKIEGLSDIQAIAAGGYHSLALTKSGDVYSFGLGAFGQLGHGDPDDQVAPKKIEGLSNVEAIAAGSNHSLALIAEAKQDSTIHPDKASFDKNILKQQDIAVTMELNGNTLTGIMNGATLLTADKDYTIDNNTVMLTKAYLSTLPIGITTLQFTFSAGAGKSLIIEIIETGDDHHSSVFSFGAGSKGQLGHGGTANQLTPKKIEDLSDIQTIAGGWIHSLTLTKSGDVYSFGSGQYGRLGHGNTASQLAPKKIEGLSNVEAIAAGADHSLALTKSGDVYSFGYGGVGRLGHGDVANQLAPKKIEGLSNIQSISGGGDHSLALTKSGDVYSFGSGAYGQLGHGDTHNQLAPKKIEGLSDIQAIAGGWVHSLALTKSGDVYSFGYGANGRLGHGGTANQFAPKKIEGLSDIQAIAAGMYHSLALTKSGDVYSFGSGANGQLGHGDTDNQLAPKKIEGLSNIQEIAAGTAHSLALTKSGDVYSFGSGGYGQLGHGNTTNHLTPKKIEGLSNVEAIAAGYDHSLALGEAKQGSTIHPDEVSFDKNILKQQDIAVTMELNGNTLKDVKNGTTSLSEGADYIVNGYIVTITKKYLANLPIGTTTLVFTFSAGNDATLSITVSDSTTIPPTDLQTTAGDGEVALSWTAFDPVDGYNVYIQEAKEGTPPDVDRWMLDNGEAPVTGTSYKIDNLTAGKLYWFAVTTVKDGMESGYSDSKFETPYTTVAKVASPRVIEVGKGFTPEKLEEYLPEHIQIQLTSLPLTMDAGVKWDLEHSNYNPEQVGTYVVTGELQLPEYVRNPQLLQAEIAVHVLPNTNARLSGITLNGEPLENFDRDIYTYDVVFSYATEQVTVTAATYDPAANYEVVGEVVRGEDQPLKVGSNRIDVLVTAEDQQEQATYTLYVKRQPDAEAPKWPKDGELTVSDITQTGMKLSWPSATDNVGVSGYRIYVDGKEHTTVSGSVDAITVNGLTANTTYKFKVTAYDAEGNESSPLANQATTALSSSGGGDSGHSNSGHGDSSHIVSTNGTITISVGSSGEVSLDGEIVIKIPTGAEAQELRITIEKLLDTSGIVTDQETLVSKVFEVLKNFSGNFKKPVKVSMKIDPTKVGHNQKAAIHYYDEEKKTWVEVGGTVDGTWITAEVDHFTKFAVLAVDLKKDDNGETPKQPDLSFTDIAGHWGENFILRAVEQKLVSGYPDGTFKPDSPVTRAEFTVMLAGALQLNGTEAPLNFTDQAKIGAWAKRAVGLAVQAGNINGYEDGSFRPNAQITRAEMAAMIARAMRLSQSADASTGFADDADIAGWAKGAVEAIRKRGIVSGRGDNNFVPNGTATRAEAVVTLLRMLEAQSTGTD